MATKVQSIQDYTGYIKCGEILKSPVQNYQNPFVLKCFTCEEIHFLLESFIIHIQEHCNNVFPPNDAIEAKTSNGNTNQNKVEGDSFIVTIKMENTDMDVEDPLIVVKNEGAEIPMIKEEYTLQEAETFNRGYDIEHHDELKETMLDSAEEFQPFDTETEEDDIFKKEMSKPKNSRGEVIKILGELDKKLDLLREHFKSFKNDVKNQNSLVVNVLGEHNIAIKSILKHQDPKYKRMFPINSMQDLKNIDEDINQTNEQEYIATVKAIIGKKGVRKGLADLVAQEVLVKFNADGTHDKLRFLNYQKFVNVLFMANYENNSSQKSFKDDIKYALKLAKNRFFKGKMKERKENNSDPVIPNIPENTSP